MLELHWRSKSKTSVNLMNEIVWKAANILDTFSVSVCHESDVRICLRPSLCDPQNHLINHRQQLLHRQQRPAFVCKLFDILFRFLTLPWHKTLTKTLSPSLNTICLLFFYPTVTCQWSQYYSSLVGTLEELFVPISKNDTSSKFDFLIYDSHFYVKFCALLSN